jgi:hypothetical protein
MLQFFRAKCRPVAAFFSSGILIGMCIVPPPAASADAPSVDTSCNQAAVISGLSPSTAIGGRPSLKTNWLTVYGDPIAYGPKAADSSQPWNRNTFTFSLGTNTFTNQNELTREQLLFRDGAAANAFFSYLRQSGTVAQKTPDNTSPSGVAKAVFDEVDRALASKAPSTGRDVVDHLQLLAADEAGKARLAPNDLVAASRARVANSMAIGAAQALKNNPQLAAAATQDAAQRNAVRLCGDPITTERVTSTDRLYIADSLNENAARMFISNGLGARAVTISGTTSTTVSEGMVYLGIGFDKPLFSIFSTTSGGYLSMEAYLTAGRAARLTTIFPASTKSSWLPTYGANFDLAFTDVIGLSVHYAKGIGTAKENLGDMAMVSLLVKTGTTSANK